MSTRRPAPPLLRPPRRPLRPILIALVLSLIGALGGVVVGLRLRPPPVPDPTVIATAEPPAAVPEAPAPALPDMAGLAAQVAALRRTLEQEQARLEALNRARAAAEAEEQARLDALARARAAAEAQLAALQRDIAVTQREASAAPARRDSTPPQPPPPPVASRPPRAEAAVGQLRIFVHHRAGSAAGAEAAAALLGPLRDSGFDVLDVRAAPAVPSQRVVRYFHAEDAATAARLAGRLGRGWAIQDFRGFEPSPSPGTLEVWVPER